MNSHLQNFKKTDNRIDWRMWMLESKPSLIEQFDIWLKLAKNEDLASDRFVNCQLEEGEASVLIRRRTNDIQENCLVIATVTLPQEHQGKGWFKSFISHCCDISPWEKIIIEDVKNDRLRHFLKRINCRTVSQNYIDSYILNIDEVKKLNAPKLKSLTLFPDTTENKKNLKN